MNKPLNEVYLNKLLNAAPPEKHDEIVESVKEINELVSQLESLPPTTKDYYGSYLGLANNGFMALVLLAAGANQNGVISALRINSGAAFN